jgi:hypothetical protein
VSLGKQAKTLSKGQVEATMGWLTSTSIPDEKGVILLLSVRAGLRAKEIASLTWTMVTDADRQMSRTIHLPDKASKGRSGRAIPMHRDLRSALQDLYREAKPKPDDFVVTTERSKKTSPQVIVNLFARWYEVIGLGISTRVSIGVTDSMRPSLPETKRGVNSTPLFFPALLERWSPSGVELLASSISFRESLQEAEHRGGPPSSLESPSLRTECHSAAFTGGTMALWLVHRSRKQRRCSRSQSGPEVSRENLGLCRSPGIGEVAAKYQGAGPWINLCPSGTETFPRVIC